MDRYSIAVFIQATWNSLKNKKTIKMSFANKTWDRVVRKIMAFQPAKCIWKWDIFDNLHNSCKGSLVSNKRDYEAEYTVNNMD